MLDNFACALALELVQGNIALIAGRLWVMFWRDTEGERHRRGGTQRGCLGETKCQSQSRVAAHLGCGAVGQQRWAERHQRKALRQRHPLQVHHAGLHCRKRLQTGDQGGSAYDGLLILNALSLVREVHTRGAHVSFAACFWQWWCLRKHRAAACKEHRRPQVVLPSTAVRCRNMRTTLSKADRLAGASPEEGSKRIGQQCCARTSRKSFMGNASVGVSYG